MQLPQAAESKGWQNYWAKWKEIQQKNHSFLKVLVSVRGGQCYYVHQAPNKPATPLLRTILLKQTTVSNPEFQPTLTTHVLHYCKSPTYTANLARCYITSILILLLLHKTPTALSANY